jgi:hypothetical protein
MSLTRIRPRDGPTSTIWQTLEEPCSIPGINEPQRTDPASDTLHCLESSHAHVSSLLRTISRQGHEPHRQRTPRRGGAIRPLFHMQKILHVGSSARDHHPSAAPELVDQRRWDFRWRCSDDNGIERRRLGPTVGSHRRCPEGSERNPTVHVSVSPSTSTTSRTDSSDVLRTHGSAARATSSGRLQPEVMPRCFAANPDISPSQTIVSTPSTPSSAP